MLSFLIKKWKCLYRNIPVIKFCYTRGEKERERERMKGGERGKKVRRKRAERQKTRGSDKNKNAKTV